MMRNAVVVITSLVAVCFGVFVVAVRVTSHGTTGSVCRVEAQHVLSMVSQSVQSENGTGRSELCRSPFQSSDEQDGGQSDVTPLSEQPTGSVPAVSVRFGHVDIFADAGQSSLAAYQIEVIGTVAGGTIVLVGVEGGEKTQPAFSEPPFYDPDALTRDRIVLAAFTPPGERPLATGKTRVARLHVQILTQANGNTDQRSGTPSYEVRVIAAGNATGERISATFTAEQSPVE